jgi:hypothetical protein
MTLTTRPPVVVGGSTDYVLDCDIGSAAKAVISETGLVRSVSVGDNVILSLAPYREEYVSLHDPKKILDAVYAQADAPCTEGMTAAKAYRMINEFWRPQIHEKMIVPDIHLGWRPFLHVSTGCRRSCYECPEAETFNLLPEEEILAGIDVLANAYMKTHNSHQRISNGFLDIADVTFLRGTRVSVERIVNHAKKNLISGKVSQFYGVPSTTLAYNSDKTFLKSVCSVVDVGYCGIEVVPPINMLAFYKGDSREQILAIPAILHEMGVPHVVAILQVGFEGEGFYTRRKSGVIDQDSFMPAEEIIEQTVRLVADAGFDGVRISEHVVLDSSHGGMAELRRKGVLRGENTAEQSRYRRDLLAAKLHEKGIRDIDVNYNVAITGHPDAKKKDLVQLQ